MNRSVAEKAGRLASSAAWVSATRWSFRKVSGGMYSHSAPCCFQRSTMPGMASASGCPSRRGTGARSSVNPSAAARPASSATATALECSAWFHMEAARVNGLYACMA